MGNCKRMILDQEETRNVISRIGGGCWFKNKWISKLCQCENCEQRIYDKYGLKWLFLQIGDDEVDENEDDDLVQSENVDVNNLEINPSQELNPEFSTIAMTTALIKKAPHIQTLNAMEIMKKGIGFIKQRLAEHVRQNRVSKSVDTNDIHKIFN